MTDFSHLKDPEYYRGRFTRPRATRPSGNHPVLDSQRAERFQAVHADRVNPPAPSIVVRASEWFERNEGIVAIGVGAFIAGVLVSLVIPMIGEALAIALGMVPR